MFGEEIEEIKNAFEKYDTNKTGKINPKTFLKEMSSIGLNIKAPMLFSLISELDNEDNEKKGGISIDELLNVINDKLGNEKSEEGLKKIFNLFKENSEDKNISLNSLKNLSQELGISISEEEIKAMLEKASDGVDGLTFEEFKKVMKSN